MDGRWVLADTEDEAREYVRIEWGDEYTLRDDGWFHNVGWDREMYERKRDFEADTGYSSWWESCTVKPNAEPTKNLKRAFALVASTSAPETRP